MQEILSEPPAHAADHLTRAPAGSLRPPRRARISLARAIALPRGADRLLVVAVVALAVVLLIALPASFSVDSWLALVAGRDIWQSGLPHHEALTSIAHGVRWIDQQWLSQLASYALYRVGGLGLLGVVNVALIVLGVAIALVSAWRRTVRLSVMLGMLVLCLIQVMPFREVRTQAFAVPLIAMVLVMLSRDSRVPSQRVYWCLPILVLWANLHGTASIGAGLVSLRGLTLVWDRRAKLPGVRSLRGLWLQLRRPLVLIVGAPLTLLITPYGLQTASYYRATMMNSSLQHFVTEWQPITSDWALAAPFFVLAGLTVWSFGRRPEMTTGWEKIALVVLAAASIDVMRNDLLFGLAALAFVPASVDRALPRRKRGGAPVRERVNAILCWTALAVLAITVISTVLRPASAFENSYQRPRILAVVRSAVAVDPSVKVLADVRFADWLLWHDPQLGGRIANDARFELLTSAQMVSLQRTFGAIGPSWKQGARGYRLIVLDREASPDAVKGFLAEPGRRVLYNDGHRLVILRSPPATA